MIVIGIDPGLTHKDKTSGFSVCKLHVMDQEEKELNTGFLYFDKYIYVKCWKIINLETDVPMNGYINFIKYVNSHGLNIDNIDVLAMEKQYISQYSVNLKMLKFSNGIMGGVAGWFSGKEYKVPEIIEIRPNDKFKIWKDYCTHPLDSKKRADKKNNAVDITMALLKDNKVLLKHLKKFKRDRKWDMADSFLTALTYVHKKINNPN